MSPIGIILEQNINITESSGIQIGNHNVITINTIKEHVEKLFDAIDKKDEPQEKKMEVKCIVEKVMENPLFKSLLPVLIKNVNMTTIDNIVTTIKTIIP